MNSHEIKDSLRKVMDFLEENEQYGDDWGPELTVLNWLIDEADEIERNSKRNRSAFE